MLVKYLRNMKITSITAQLRSPDRVNISIDGKYRFSLDISQVVDLGIKQGQEMSEEQLVEYERESEFGKLYARTLEYALMRPRSVREVRDYLYRKTFNTKYKSRRTGEIKERAGYAPSLAERVLEKLIKKGYVDDQKFAAWWVENRNQVKGSSIRKLRSELAAKGVSAQLVDAVLVESERNDSDEIAKIISKKLRRYPDRDKLMQYLARQGFSYDDIKSALDSID